MIRLLAIQHTYAEFLGAFETLLEARGVGFVYQRPVTGQDIAGSALQFDALWLLGGAWPVTDRAHCPWIDDELRLIQVFLRARRPVVGFGFGGLLVAQAFGGSPQAEPFFDARWAVAWKTAAGAGDPLAEAMDGRSLLVLANGRVDLPGGIAPILVDEQGEWLAIRPAPLAYGLRFRPELKPGMLEDMIMEADRPVPDHMGELLEQARGCWAGMQATAEAAATALVGALDLMRERHKAPVFTLRVVPKE